MTSAIAVRDLPVAVIGGGFSGTLLAINLLRYGVKVILIERSSAQLAKGVAFGTRRPEHLLNVRASNMSAFPDDAGHFLRWMHFSDADEANRFVPRLSYGTYLRELLVQALAKAGKDARIVDGEACAIERVDSHARVKLANGSILPCRAAVLALGNFPPLPHPVLEGLPSHLYQADPWDRTALEGLAELEEVMVVGRPDGSRCGPVAGGVRVPGSSDGAVSPRPQAPSACGTRAGGDAHTRSRTARYGTRPRCTAPGGGGRLA
ncbi:FAD/NAD(P)-binding protein [Novosphingobium panipatense]|uniref:FAD/NAD(P)-binding protein n=1 Tax=Novosphingobium panipatense TaxID=428991 RepID=UPI003608B1B0